MGVNNLTRVATRQCAGRELNLQPLDYKSNTLPLHYRVTCKLKQNANEGCNSCASLGGLVLCFIACFILLVIAP